MLDRVWGKYPNEDTSKGRWITKEELLTQDFFVIYGDPRGDYSVLFSDNEINLSSLVAKVYRGDYTDSEYACNINFIMCNGVECESQVVVNLIPVKDEIIS